MWWEVGGAVGGGGPVVTHTLPVYQPLRAGVLWLMAAWM